MSSREVWSGLLVEDLLGFYFICFIFFPPLYEFMINSWMSRPHTFYYATEMMARYLQRHGQHPPRVGNLGYSLVRHGGLNQLLSSRPNVMLGLKELMPLWLFDLTQYSPAPRNFGGVNNP